MSELVAISDALCLVIGVVGLFGRTHVRLSLRPNMLCRLFSSATLDHKKKTEQVRLFRWSGRHDSNMRHLAPKASTLPG